MNKIIVLIGGGIVFAGGMFMLFAIDTSETDVEKAIVETASQTEEIAEEKVVVIEEEKEEERDVLEEDKPLVAEEVVVPVATPTYLGFGGLISPVEFQAKMDNGEYVVLDVRTPEEYENQRIGDDALSLNFYDADFAQQLDALDKSKKYLLHCKSGGRSSKAATMMKSLGFEEFYELRGGINNWNAEDLPTFSGEAQEVSVKKEIAQPIAIAKEVLWKPSVGSTWQW